MSNTPSAAPGNGNEQTTQSPEQKQLQDQLKTLLEGNSELNKDIVALFDRMSDDMKKRVNIGDYFKAQSDALNTSKDPVKNLETRQKTTKWLFDLLLWDADTKGNDIYRTEIAELKGKYEKEVGSVTTETRSKVSEAEPDFRTVGTKLLSNLPNGTSLYKVEVDGTDIGKSLLRIVDEKNGKLLHSIPLKGDGSFIGNINEYTYTIGEKPYKISKNGEKYEFKDVSVPLKKKGNTEAQANQVTPAARPVKTVPTPSPAAMIQPISTPSERDANAKIDLGKTINENSALQSKLEVTGLLETGEIGKIGKLKNLPGVSFMKYENQDDMNLIWGKITAFTENNAKDFSDKKTWNYAGGHDLSSESIAKYANTFRQNLTGDEKLLLERLKTEGIIEEKGEKYIGVANKAALAMFYPTGEKVQLNGRVVDGDKIRSQIKGGLDHELAHGLYFTNPEFKKVTDDIWQSLDPKTRKEISEVLGKNYKNSKFHATEFLSYVLFTEGKSEINTNIIPNSVSDKDTYLKNLRSQIYTTIDAKKDLSSLVKSFFDMNRPGQ